MKPPKHNHHDADLFRERLDAIIDMKHSLGRPAKPTRLMAGLHYLKHLHDLSDEEAVERWVENPYGQYLCGFEANVYVCSSTACPSTPRP